MEETIYNTAEADVCAYCDDGVHVVSWATMHRWMEEEC